MSFKDQLTADFEKVFLNKDEMADAIFIDGVEVAGIFEENSGEYEEVVPTISIALSVAISKTSVIVVNDVTYCVVAMKPPRFGERIVILGKGTL
jgi:hypothetical protein